MTWAAWRVQRSQLVAGTLAVVVLLAWLGATGLSMGHDPTWKYWTDGDLLVLEALPALLGLGLGAPLVAGELRDATYRLAWTQGVAPRRWLTRRLLLSAGTVALLGAALSGLLGWWTSAVSLSPLSDSGGFTGFLIRPQGFDVTGLVVVAYGLFAFCLGVVLGAWIGRPGWAFAIGIPVYALARLAIEEWVRPVLLRADDVAQLAGVGFVKASSWVTHEGVVPLRRLTPLPGHPWSFATPPAYQACVAPIELKNKSNLGALAHCARAAHLHFVVQYQPASHYWPLQGAEGAIFLAAGAVLVALSYLGLARRRADGGRER